MNLPAEFLSYLPQYIAQNPVPIVDHGVGYEIGYDQITGNVGVASISSAAPTTIIAPSAHMFDGAPVLAEFHTPLLSLSVTVAVNFFVGLYEGSTLIAQLIQASNGNPPVGATNAWQAAQAGRLRFAPTAGSHSYSIGAWGSINPSATVVAGTGTGGGYTPAYLRFTKV